MIINLGTNLLITLCSQVGQGEHDIVTGRTISLVPTIAEVGGDRRQRDRHEYGRSYGATLMQTKMLDKVTMS